MTKSQKRKKSSASSSTFAEALRKEHGLTVKESESITKTFFKTIEESLSDDRDVILTRIGTLKVTHQDERVSMSPRKGKRVLLSERKLLKFEPSRLINQELNKDNPTTYREISEDEAQKLMKSNKKK